MALLSLLLAFALASGAATAATAGTTLLVMMTISGGCTVTTAASNIQLLLRPTVATGTLDIACVHPTPYNVGLGLGPGGGAGATTMTRWMTGPGGALARYGLFQDAALTANFGSTMGADTVAGIGGTTPRTITVYGSVPDPAALLPGAYADVVTVTVTF